MKEEKELENVPKIIVFCLNKADEFLQNKKFIKSFMLGLIAILIGFILAFLYYFRTPIIFIISCVVVFYVLYIAVGL